MQITKYIASAIQLRIQNKYKTPSLWCDFHIKWTEDVILDDDDNSDANDDGDNGDNDDYDDDDDGDDDDDDDDYSSNSVNFQARTSIFFSLDITYDMMMMKMTKSFISEENQGGPNNRGALPGISIVLCRKY